MSKKTYKYYSRRDIFMGKVLMYLARHKDAKWIPDRVRMFVIDNSTTRAMNYAANRLHNPHTKVKKEV